MKHFLVLTCLALGACTPYYQRPMEAYTPPPVPSYALQPPAYEQSAWSIQQKEQEIFAKEKALLSAQDDLYRREKMLADREADFITKSKALSYKEEMINRSGSQPNSSYSAIPQPPLGTIPTYQTTLITEEIGTYSTEVPPSTSQKQPSYVPQKVPSAYSSQPQGVMQSNDGFIIMQHPIQRDLVRCPVTDDVCLSSYERLGYIQSKNLSRFTAEDDCTLETDYPAGKWRDNNVIPRW